ncbi:MAG: hypothetical protein AAFR30_01135 [Cyanobacteria bacterium J06628_4]
MEPSPLHFVSHTHYYRGGDVVVDAAAAIAPGVVLRAAPGGSIRISAGACVGAGVVIQAKHGCVFIEAGVSLGTGVLIVGHGYVGKDACVGSSSTLINPAIAPSDIIPPCSLIQSQAASSNPASPTSGNGASGFQTSGSSSFQSTGFQAANEGPVPSMPIPPRTTSTVQPQAVSPKAVNVPDVEPPPPPENGKSAIVKPNGYVYGRDHVNSLLSALFPHRQSLSNGTTDNRNAGDQSREDV